MTSLPLPTPPGRALLALITLLASALASAPMAPASADPATSEAPTEATHDDLIDLTGDAATQALAALRTTIAASPDDFEAQRDAGIILHQRARTDPKEDTVLASEGYLKAAHALRPDDLETSAWLGSVTTMKAIFISDPGKQTFFVKLGTRQMDQAVRAAPDDPLLRLIRAHNSMELPVFLKRTRFAVEDFSHYLELCKTQYCPPHRVAEATERLAEARSTVAAQQ